MASGGFMDRLPGAVDVVDCRVAPEMIIGGVGGGV